MNLDDNDSGSFHFRLDPMQQMTSSITVVNGETTQQTVDLYPVDATTTGDGELAMRNQSDPKTDIGRWISLAQTRLILMPHESKQVGFTLSVPRTATIGDHIGGIIVQPEASRSVTTDQNIHLQVISRLAVRVYETLGGNIVRSVEARNFSLVAQKHLTARIVLRNNGNVAVRPRGKILVRAGGSAKTEAMALPEVALLPHRSVTIIVTSQAGRPLLWRYTAQLDLHYDGGRLTKQRSAIWYDPSMIIILIGLIGLLLIIALRKKLRRLLKI